MEVTDKPASKIGIIGGSFNPIHLAHCRIAEEFIKQTECDVCYFVPTAISPFKQHYIADVSDDHRLQMLRLATSYNHRFRLSDCEILRGSVSYTIDTILYFRELHPNSTLYLLIGQDQAEQFYSWNSWQTILECVQLCIVHRPESVLDSHEISRILTHQDKQPLWIHCMEMNVSSTAIRENIYKGNDVSSMVSPEVMAYIQLHHLYENTSANIR